ncbi:hypothetical protein ILUMI_09709 [Ignelater luminosus]|uniref:Nucleoporin NUP53 n=1 Tax=Ignelater luminosus TaxID=2038154 RepID=A0A8K0D3P2_IGNLU|nr:hypothetical protein ILUMI_09709 [Ignelater luminosus]
MEPMNLGSAPSSPSSPGVNPNFLPAFLMGDNQPSSPNPSFSPDRSRNFSYTINSPPETGSIRSRLFSAGETQTVIVPPALDISIDKPGPPKQGLFDTLEVKKSTSTPTFNNRQNYTTDSPLMHNLSRSAIHNHGLNDSGSLTRNDSFSSIDAIKGDINSNLWVTIFGFPPSCAGMVLARLANCGTIVEKRFPAQGNWAHVKFSSPHETAKALALNGKLISNCVMIGVILHQNKEANKENTDTSLYTSPIRWRPLRQSFASPQNSNTVLPPQNVPQKSTGLVTKAMEYVFGW